MGARSVCPLNRCGPASTTTGADKHLGCRPDLSSKFNERRNSSMSSKTVRLFLLSATLLDWSSHASASIPPHVLTPTPDHIITEVRQITALTNIQASKRLPVKLEALVTFAR